MKKIIFLLLLFGATTLQAQESKTCFVDMPDSICPLLSTVNRADFIDFLDSKMKAEVTNNLGGKSEMTELTSDYIRVRMSEQSTWQMKLLPMNDSVRIVCTISTVCAPACDSHVRFYTTDWQSLPASDYLPSLPKWEDFSPTNLPQGEASDTIVSPPLGGNEGGNILLLQADLSASEPTLTFTLTTPDYLSKEEAEKLTPLLRREKVYRWTDGKFLPSQP